MVPQRQHIGLVTLQVHLRKVLALSQRTLAITHAVTLYVGLGHHIDACLVAQVVPARIVRIVAGAHGIDVQLLHNAQVLLHALYAHNIASIGVQFVAVGTFY